MNRAKTSDQNGETRRRPRPQSVDSEARAVTQLKVDFEREYRRALDASGSAKDALNALVALAKDELSRTEDGRRWLKTEYVELELKLQTAENFQRVKTTLAGVVRPEAANRWLATPNAQLGGATPGEAIQHGETERVLELIASVAEGLHT